MNEDLTDLGEFNGPKRALYVARPLLLFVRHRKWGSNPEKTSNMKVYSDKSHVISTACRTHLARISYRPGWWRCGFPIARIQSEALLRVPQQSLHSGVHSE